MYKAVKWLYARRKSPYLIVHGLNSKYTIATQT